MSLERAQRHRAWLHRHKEFALTQQVFSGASAIVTGGAGGLGEATVRRLHADGLKVVIADLADDKGHKLADELGEGTVFVNTDVANDDSVAGAIAKASELDTLRYAVITHGGFGGRPERIVGRDGQSAPHRQCAAIRPGWPPSSAPTGGHHSK
ncbi:hypothetical protein MPRS_15650 [Mycobacterium paraseoulense]|nr:hypothetical protein MPRS_15650 [Mycobacterium paraseoulense]